MYMRRFLAIITLLCATAVSAVAQELKWVNATELGIHGYTKKTDKNPYYRFDHTPYTWNNSTIVGHSKKCTGLYISFKTNSSQIAATWENVPRRTADNMTGIVQLGLDLYIKVDGERAKYWLTCGAQPTDTVRILLKKTGVIEK